MLHTGILVINSHFHIDKVDLALYYTFDSKILSVHEILGMIREVMNESTAKNG